MAPEMSVTDQHSDAIKELRSTVSDIIHPDYDTDFNMLRWLQSNEFNVPKSSHLLRKHLKWRKERKLDEEGECGLQSSTVSQKYAPLCIIGENREGGDRLVVVDQAGKIDINGVLKSIQPTEYLHQMFRNFEDMYKKMKEIEARTGTQCFVHYIFDLDGLEFDPFLLPIVNGPFRVSWQLTSGHYREFIDKFIVVNAPSYINMLWAAISPFIPEHSRNKIVFAGNDWKEELLSLIEPDHLPQKYGGTIPDKDVLRFPTPVPKELYWTPRSDYPAMAELHKVSVPAGKQRILTYYVQENTMIYIYSHNENDLTITIFYSAEENVPESEWEAVVPPIPKCGLPAMDCFDYFCENTGYYHLRITNEHSWLLPSPYRVLVHDSDANEIPALQNEKWIKKGAKPKKK